MGLGDLYDGAFRIIRFNPRATVGSAVLVAAVAMSVPVLVTAVLTWAVNLSLDSSDMSDADAAGLIGSFGALGLGTLLQGLGMILVTGMVAHVASAAAIGRRLSLGEAWTATRGKRWRLLGLAFLLGTLGSLALVLYAGLWVLLALADPDAVGYVVFGVVTLPLFAVLMSWFWIRVYYLPVPALMLEEVGVFRAVGRGFALTRRQFWRTFGIGLLTILIASAASYALALPLSFAGPLIMVATGPEYAVLALMVVQALSSVASAAFITPFTSTVTALQYLDQRMRKEGYDVELLARSGVAPS
ncbi:hypothetical protein [Nocardioides ferulae]|uniref:hypothetical protein n=1 Tax=Nocardioides ferulae TaxID=2340821 RepID=UPI000EAC3559|nr:hypothetical protein [Nocardioides ferulae]